MYEFLKYDLENGVVTITLNRPDVYNALNNEITYELQAALKMVKKDPQVRVVVLTGAGKAFCSGQDLKASSAEPNRSFLIQSIKGITQLLLQLEVYPNQ